MRPKQPSRRRAVVGISTAIFLLALFIVVPLSGVSSPWVVDSRLFGGAGDQIAAKATFSAGQLFVAYNNGSAAAGMMGRFATAPGLPQQSGAALPAVSLELPG